MDYEKKYKNALERARDAYNRGYYVSGDLEYIFPELKMSDDERIRKGMLQGFKDHEEPEYEWWKGIKVKECIAWLEKQGESYTKKDVDDAYLKGISDTKNEIEKQYEANYQIRKDIATFIFNYRGDIKDRAKWMDYLGIKVSFVEKKGEKETLCGKCRKEQPSHSCQDITALGRCAVEHEQKPTDKYKGLTDFERTLADICVGWIGEELGWKSYIKDNADILLKISFKKWNEVQDVQIEPKSAWSEEDGMAIDIAIKALNHSIVNESDRQIAIELLKALKQRLNK